MGVSETLYHIYYLFVLEPYEFFSVITLQDFVFFFLPAILIDFPRFILSDVVVLAKEWFFPDNYRYTEFAQKLKRNPPFVSVLLPGYNEGETVGKTIESFKKNTYKNLEIIVVSDGSDDDMVRVCQEYATQGKIRFFIHKERSGKSAAANYALKMARGEYVVIADADTTFDRDCVYEILLPFADPKVGGVSGNLRVRNWRTNLLTRFQALEYIFSISIGRRFSSMLGMLAIVSGAFGAFRKSALQKIGGWDTGPGEDADITIRLRKAGYRIIFTAKAMCMTDTPEKWKAIWKQRLRWNRSLIRFRWRKHKDVYYNASSYDLGTVAGMADSFFFQVVMPFIRVPYFLSVALLLRESSHIIFVGTLGFYFASNVLQWIVAMLLSERPFQDFRLGWALPFFTLYRLYETFNRIIACIDEIFFETSFTDRYVPSRVQKRAERNWWK